MQKVKFVMRHFAENPIGEFITAPEVEEYLAYQYLSQGWSVLDQHVSDVYDENRKFMGYRLLFTLVKDE